MVEALKGSGAKLDLYTGSKRCQHWFSQPLQATSFTPLFGRKIGLKFGK